MRPLVITGILALALFASCKDDPTVPDPIVTPPEFTSLEKQAFSSANTFGFRLLAAANAEQAGKNLFISPLSVSIALGMTLNGAEGTTFDSMQAALNLGELTRQQINDSYRTILTALPLLDPLVTFDNANSLWYRTGFSVEPSFIADNTSAFNAEVRSLDFSSAGAVDIINGWINEKTHEKIPKVLDTIDPSVVMFLINALYFKGTWTYQFAPDQTVDGPFTRPDGSTVTCRMMHQKADLRYGVTDSVQVIDLPYGGGAYSMTVLLPAAGADIDAFASSLSDERWQSLTGGLQESEVVLSFPRFKLEYGQYLPGPLSAMGMGIAFTPAANFSRINPNFPLAISDVIHKTFVEVNEEGTEAAAVTVVSIYVTSVQPHEIRMDVDRPFLFAIREHSTGGIIFIGKIVDPTAEHSGS